MDEKTQEKLGIVEETAAGYLEAMKLYELAKFSTNVDVREKLKELERLAKQGEISLVMGNPRYSNSGSRLYSRKVDSLRYEIFTELTSKNPQKLKVEVVTQQNIRDALEDFGNLTGFYNPAITSIRERPKEEYEEKISKKTPRVIWGASGWRDLTR